MDAPTHLLMQAMRHLPDSIRAERIASATLQLEISGRCVQFAVLERHVKYQATLNGLIRMGNNKLLVCNALCREYADFCVANEINYLDILGNIWIKTALVSYWHQNY